MDTAPPGAVLLASTDDEVASRLETALAPRPVRRDPAAAEDVRVAVLCRHPDPAPSLAAWRARPATAAVPVLMLGDDLAGADALLPLDASPAVLRAQIDLLARVGHTERRWRDRIQEVLD